MFDKIKRNNAFILARYLILFDIMSNQAFHGFPFGFHFRSETSDRQESCGALSIEELDRFF